MVKFLRLAFAVFVVFSGVVALGDDDDHERARELQSSGVILPLEKIIAKTQQLYPESKVLEIDFKEKRAAFIYEIEIVDKHGVVKELVFDARSGNLIKTKHGD